MESYIIRRKEPPDRSSGVSETVEYSQSMNDASWARERGWADRIMNFIRGKNLNFILDKLTRGRGNCFMIATLQQMNRGEVADVACPEHIEMVRSMDHHPLTLREPK